MHTTASARGASIADMLNPVATADVDVVGAAELVLRRFGARAISLITAPRALEDGRVITGRLSANDCYVALDEACRKVARVALRRHRQAQTVATLGESLDRLFPDPAAYLARAIRSVISDAARATRREAPTVSLETPLGRADGESSLHLGDVLAESDGDKLPEAALVDRSEREEFRAALKGALAAMPANYLAALQRDIARAREKERGRPVAPDSDRDRQALCRARAALSQMLRRECSEDNPFIRLLGQQRSSRVRQRPRPTAWTGEQQEALFRKIMQTGWTERATARADDSMEEAIVNDVSAAGTAAPPSPELRQAMRVLDLYTVDRPTPRTQPAQELYERARALRKAGKIEEALRCYRACHEAEPTFVEALNEVGVMQSQRGELRDALRVYLDIIERHPASEHRLIAATNAADIYLTWFDAGRNRDRNIAQAIHYARMAMERPTPMRACNLLLAYVKDRYFNEARGVVETVMRSDDPACPPERFLQTLFQIRDADLVAWWSWLDTELGEGVASA